MPERVLAPVSHSADSHRADDLASCSGADSHRADDVSPDTMVAELSYNVGEFKEIQVAWSQIPRYVRKSGKESMLLDRGSIVDLERSCINLKPQKTQRPKNH